MVQVQLKNKTKWATEKNYFSKIVCSCCGNRYGGYVWHSNSKYKKYIYRCSHKYKGKEKCATPHLTDETIQSWIVDAINLQIANREEIMSNLSILVNQLVGDMTLQNEITSLNEQLDSLHKEVENIVLNNSKVVQNQVHYQKSYDILVKEYEKLEKILEKKKDECVHLHTCIQDLKACIETIEKQESLIEKFDWALFNILIEAIRVETDNSVVIYYTNGQVISMG